MTDVLFDLLDEPRPAGPRRVKVAGDLYHGVVPAGAVYVGRGAPGLPASRYANRHRIGDCRTCGRRHDRAGAVLAYAGDLADQPELVAAVRRELAGADLACWCRLDEHPCHADVLLSVAAGLDPRAAVADLLPADDQHQPPSGRLPR